MPDKGLNRVSDHQYINFWVDTHIGLAVKVVVLITWHLPTTFFFIITFTLIITSRHLEVIMRLPPYNFTKRISGTCRITFTLYFQTGSQCGNISNSKVETKQYSNSSSHFFFLRLCYVGNGNVRVCYKLCNTHLPLYPRYVTSTSKKQRSIL